MNRNTKAMLKGVIVAWGFVAILAIIVGIIGLVIAHPFIGVPVAISAIGALLGWVIENDEDDLI